MADQDSGDTTSQEVIQLIRSQIDSYVTSRLTEQRAFKSHSLLSLTTDLVLQELESSEDINTATLQIADSLDPIVFGHILKSPKASYRLLRAFYSLPAGPGRRAIDLEEAIIRNEHYLRSRSNTDGKYLVSLEDLAGALSATTVGQEDCIDFVRKDPPKGGLEVLDDLRKNNIQILSHNTSFRNTFDRITNGILKGLDWSNLLLVGEMVLLTLMHTNPAKDDEKTVQDPQLFIYVHGLNPEDANQKAKEIHDIWVANLQVSAERLVVKSADAIDFLPSYPHRRIRVVLKLFSSPTDILLAIGLDPYAISFDGCSVLMLPRCARAIETGYSTFTSKLVSDHRSADVQALTGASIFTCANQGFGLRFLASSAKYLERDHCTNQEAGDTGSLLRDQRSRYPFGFTEPGLLTLKRVAYLARDYVYRYTLGPTALTVYPGKKLLPSSDPFDTSHVENITLGSEDEWQCQVNEAKMHLAVLNAHNTLALSNDEVLLKVKITESYLGGYWRDSFNVLDNFEIFIRYCEAWGMHIRQESIFDMDCRWAGTKLDFPDSLSEKAQMYRWNKSFNPIRLRDFIDFISNDAFWLFKQAIDNQFDIGQRPDSDYRNYLTRRIRYHTYGDDFETVQEKQLTIPLLIPQQVEDYLVHGLQGEYPDLPSTCGPIIPLHDSANFDAAQSPLPSLIDNTTKDGNWRYWVITNTSIWTRPNGVLDEITDVLRSIRASKQYSKSFACFDPDYLHRWHRPRHFETLDRKGVEKLLFREWVLPTIPAVHFRGDPLSDMPDVAHPLFDDYAVRYPFPNDLFWNEGDQGERDVGDGVPDWRDAAVEECSIIVGKDSATPPVFTGDIKESPFFKGRLQQDGIRMYEAT